MVPMQLHRVPRHSAGLLSDHLSLDLPNRESAREIEILSIPGPDLDLHNYRLRPQFGNIMVIKLYLTHVAPGRARNPINYFFQVNYYGKISRYLKRMLVVGLQNGSVASWIGE